MFNIETTECTNNCVFNDYYGCWRYVEILI